LNVPDGIPYIIPLELLARAEFFTENSYIYRGILLSLHQIAINYNIMAYLNRIKVLLVDKCYTGK
jgi:hypothetical protein